MATLAEHTPENERVPVATVMDARRDAEDHWFVFTTAEGLEAVIAFDTVAFDYRSDDPETIRTINFLRQTRYAPGRVKTAQVEGGRADWGDEIVDTLAVIRDGEING